MMILIRTAGLTDVPGAWALYALLGALALASAAALLWRRPVGAREFGFLAAHIGVLLIMGGVAAGGLFGYAREDLQLGTRGPPQTVPEGPAGRAAFAVALRGIREEEFPPEFRALAWVTGGEPQELPMDASAPGSRSRWCDLDVEVLEFLPRAVPEAHVIDGGAGLENPAVRVEVTGPAGAREFVLGSFTGDWRAEPDLGLELRYDRLMTAGDADETCRRDRDGEPEKLQVVLAGKGVEDEAVMEFGRAKVGTLVHLPGLGLRLRVERWLSGARPGTGGVPVQAPPGRGAFPAIEFRPVGEAPEEPGARAPGSFWVLGGEDPTRPVGEVPTQLAGMAFVYNPPVWQALGVRVVEGPLGSFRLVELVDGRMAKIRPIAIGQSLDVELGRGLRLKEFLRGARTEYRPGAPGPGKAEEPAVRLAASRGAVRQDFWLFPLRSEPLEVLGGNFAVRARGGGLRVAGAVLEIFEGRESKGLFTVERGRALVHRGYALRLAGPARLERSGGQAQGLVSFTVSRRPGTWVALAGMLLLAAGAPWLLWSRFRFVPDSGGEY
jgi:hypothetical protein